MYHTLEINEPLLLFASSSFNEVVQLSLRNQTTSYYILLLLLPQEFLKIAYEKNRIFEKEKIQIFLAYVTPWLPMSVHKKI